MTGHNIESRRTFLTTTVVAGAALAGNTTSVAQDSTSPDSGRLHVQIAGYKYDRVEALIDGRVQVDGCQTRFEETRIGDMNTHLFSGPKTWEVTEIGLLPFILALANEEFKDYTLVPVFPLREDRYLPDHACGCRSEGRHFGASVVP